jgi:hypothetical protein
MKTRRHRPGLTLIEILVSVVLTLLVVFSIVQAFDMLGDSITEGRATIELAGQLRNAYFQLQRDLDGLTCAVEPSVDPASGTGYFEYVEGFRSDVEWEDRDSDGTFDPGEHVAQPWGDIDDVLAFTIRSRGAPFRGRGPNGIVVESTLAEVVWWVAQIDLNSNQLADSNDPFVLLRRLLLIRPDLQLGTVPLTAAPPNGSPDKRVPFFRTYDISARIEFDGSGAPIMVANSLSDLANRRNRFAHEVPDNATVAASSADAFPNRVVDVATRLDSGSPPYSIFSQVQLPLTTPPTFQPGHIVFPNIPNTPNTHCPTRHVQFLPNDANPGLRAWSFLPRLIAIQYSNPADIDLNLGWTGDLQDVASNWVVLSDVLAFDVRAFDSTAPIYGSAAGFAVAPGDIGYLNKVVANPPIIPIGSGAFVDLSYVAAGASTFSLSGTAATPTAPAVRNAYDTWSLGYDRDGVDQDRDSAVDEGENGLDDDGNGLVDDLAEREALPPYNSPLTGIEIRLRMIDTGTRQVRQVSVVGDFVRE